MLAQLVRKKLQETDVQSGYFAVGTKIFVTGSAGFIGFHLCEALLRAGFIVHGYDAITDYYDVTLKQRRLSLLSSYANFSWTRGELEDYEVLHESCSRFETKVIVHLAAQAGVRYSLENPRAYVNSNLVGTFNVMEIARELGVQHLLMASTSSVYGANEDMPFIELEKTDTPLTLYAATKKANENMAHSYAHLWKIPTTMFRFFTVYGPWGRPDMALFKFVKAILEGTPIDIYNHGEMFRDFTYVGDLVQSIRLLIDAVPQLPDSRRGVIARDSLSPVAPYRVVNIGNSEKVRLLDFISSVEAALGKTAKRNYMPIQKGDVPATWANADLLEALTGYRPKTSYEQGVRRFVDWYIEYYKE